MKNTSTGLTQKSTKTSTICKFFNRSGGCRFGDKCRYLHVQENQERKPKDDDEVEIKAVEQCQDTAEISKSSATNKGALETSRDEVGISVKKREIRRPICRYFLRSGYCRDGEKCRFLHHANVSKKILGKGNEVAPKETPSDRGTGAANANSTKLDNSGKSKPDDFGDKLSELTIDGMQYYQAIEIEQLRKRFGNEDLKITQEEHGTVCSFKTKPSDPDWPYDVNEIQLRVTFPQEYPKQIFEAVVMNDDGEFPANFTKYINNDIQKHLKEHEDAQKLRDSPDLLFRPFLRWLDRNLESLFTKALKQIKYDLEAQSAGLEFIPFENKDGMKNLDEEKEDTSSVEVFNLEQNMTKLDVEEVPTEVENEMSAVEKDESSSMFEMIEARKSVNLKKGTEIRFRGVELHENTATVRVTTLTLTVQCVRCKNRDEMPNVKENTQVVLTCSKCSSAQRIVFTSSEVVHQHSATVAYINPQGCLPIDLILSECELMLGCFDCSKETQIKGINYGSTKNVWCHHCHNKLDMKVESARFYHLQPASLSDEKIKTVEVKRNVKNKKEPPIKSGQTLPENGTCKHYKKSYRWMRFPCCGKCYPCDKCHEESEDGGHEMEQATRMICGFCSKEQAFSQKGCVSCKSFVTAVHTSHWEGGRGCRNKIKMSRGDDKKYSDKSKTVSRHSIKVDGQRKK